MTSTLFVASARLFSLLALIFVSGCVAFSTERQVNYGLNHYRMGLYNQAIPHLVDAANSLEQTSPPDPRLVDVLIALGVMAESKKRNDLAADFYPRALKAADTIKPADITRVRNALVYSGIYYLGQHRYGDAEPLLQRVVTITAQDQSFPRMLHAIDLDNLSLAYSGLGRYAEAEALSARALHVLDKTIVNADTIKTRGVIFYNLAYLLDQQRRDTEAESLYLQALNTLAPPGHTPIAETWRIDTVLQNYANFLHRIGRDKEAKALELRMKSQRSSPNAIAQPATPAPVVDQAPVDVFLIPVDDFPFDFAFQVARQLSIDLNLNVRATLAMGAKELTPLPNSTQLAAEDIIEQALRVSLRLPNRRDQSIAIALTTQDMNERSQALRYVFAQHNKTSRTSAISIARLRFSTQPTAITREQVFTRVFKMTKRAIGEQYFQLPRSSDINDIMYAPIMSLDDIDSMGTNFKQ